MADVIATARGYFGGVLREEWEPFSIADAVLNDPKLRPSWVRRLKGETAAAPADDAGALDKLTVKELRDLAKDRGIKLSAGVTAKADIIAAIEAGTQDDDDALAAPFDDAPAPVTVQNDLNDAHGATQPDWIAPGTDI